MSDSRKIVLPITDEEKRVWMNGIGKNTYISDYAKRDPLFFETSCILTNALYRYRISGELWWTKPPIRENNKNIFETNKIIQFSFRDDDELEQNDGEHMLIVWHDDIVQSMYGYFCWSDCTLREEYKKILSNEMINIDDLAKITDTHVEYWKNKGNMKIIASIPSIPSMP